MQPFNDAFVPQLQLLSAPCARPILLVLLVLPMLVLPLILRLQLRLLSLLVPTASAPVPAAAALAAPAPAVPMRNFCPDGAYRCRYSGGRGRYVLFAGSARGIALYATRSAGGDMPCAIEAGDAGWCV